MKLLIFNQKGGVGKSTLSIQIAYGLFRTGCQVELVDTDPQGTSTTWYNDCEIEPIFNASVKHTPSMLNDQNMNSPGWTIIDGCMTSIQTMTAAIKTVDLVLIPVTPSQLDLDATELVEELIITRQHVNKKLKAAYIINNANNNTALSQLKEALRVRVENLKIEYPDLPPFKCLREIVGRRLVHSKTVGRGATVWQARTSGKDRECNSEAKSYSIDEMEQLVKEIITWSIDT